MKKLLLTLSLVALFNVATQAQDPVKTKTKKETVNPDGTTTVTDGGQVEKNPAKKEEPKKSGTRMAINEKGTAGTKGPKKETAKQTTEESTVSPTGPNKPH